ILIVELYGSIEYAISFVMMMAQDQTEARRSPTMTILTTIWAWRNSPKNETPPPLGANELSTIFPLPHIFSNEPFQGANDKRAGTEARPPGSRRPKVQFMPPLAQSPHVRRQFVQTTAQVGNCSASAAQSRTAQPPTSAPSLAQGLHPKIH